MSVTTLVSGELTFAPSDQNFCTCVQVAADDYFEVLLTVS